MAEPTRTKVPNAAECSWRSMTNLALPPNWAGGLFMEVGGGTAHRNALQLAGGGELSPPASARILAGTLGRALL